MEKTKFYPNLKLALKIIIAVIFCSYQFNDAIAQTTRSYATREATAVSSPANGSVQNAGYANDNNPATMSTLTQSASLSPTAYAEQMLDFSPNSSPNTTYPGVIAANTPITIKIELPSAVLDVVNKIEIQAITGLGKTGSNWTYTNVGTALTGSVLLAVLSGQGTSEVTITPSVPFQGIRVRVYKPLLLSNTVGIYHAYINVPAAGNIVCNGRIDILSGVKPTVLLGGLLSATANVSNPWNATDNSQSTYAQLTTGADVLNEVYHTTIFNTLSKVGDSLKIRLRDINGALLSVGALTGFKIKLYNNKNLVQTIVNDPALLNLTLSDPLSNIMELSVVPDVAFDRVEIVIGGILNVFSGVRIYDVSRKDAGVSLTTGQRHSYVYAGQPYTLSASAIAAGDSVVFYDAQTNGNIVPAGPHATTIAPNDTFLIFYAGTVRSGCSESPERKLLEVHVIGFVRDIPDTGYVGQMYNSDVIIVADADSLPLPTHIHYMATSVLPAGLSLDTHTGLITGIPATAETVSLQVTAMDEANNLLVGNFNYTMLILPNIALGRNFELTYDVVESQVILNWVTHAENLSAGFTIQRSTDGSKFTYAGTVNSKYEKGTGTGEMKYGFTDNAPSEGINFYRLQQADLNGKTYYSNVVSAFVNRQGNISIYPNPVKNILNIQAAKANTVYIYNAAGQLVSLIKVTQSNIAIDVSGLANGVYSVKVEGNATNSIMRFIVSH